MHLGFFKWNFLSFFPLLFSVHPTVSEKMCRAECEGQGCPEGHCSLLLAQTLLIRDFPNEKIGGDGREIFEGGDRISL